MGYSRRRLVPLVLALALVLVASGSVTAASATVTTLRDTCTLSGGTWNSGFVALRVRATESGLAGVTVIRFTASLMHQPRSGGTTWTTHQTQVRALGPFADTARPHSRTWTAAWNLGGDSANYVHRIEMRVEFMNSNGWVVAARGVFGSSC